MPRQTKPYLCRCWYVNNIGGKRHRLCRQADGLKAARDTLQRLRVEIDDNSNRPLPSLSVAELVALFLDNVKVERSIHTYIDY